MTVIRLLDDLRHDLAFTWQWTTWIGNISAGIIVAAAASLFWPPLRRSLEGWLETKLADHHGRILDSFKAHLEEKLAPPGSEDVQ